MPRYIDADALVKEAVKESNQEGAYGYMDTKSIVDLINDAPTASVVEVVRCKDCKWYGRADKRRFYRGMDCLQHRIDTIVPDKDFCSRGERRDDD